MTRRRQRLAPMAAAAACVLALCTCCSAIGEPEAQPTAEPTAPATMPRSVTSRKGATPAQALRTTTPGSPLGTLPPSRNAPADGLTPTPGGGGYTQVTIPGPRSGHTGSAIVWFPPGYQDPQNTATQYPVIEAFHGFKPAPLTYFSYYRLDSVMADLVRQRRLLPAVIVIPDWAPGNQDTECVDGGGSNIKMETWLTQDVPAWIASTYRVKRDRASWAGMGVSTGGWCGLMASVLHPETFGAAISLGGQGYPDFDPPYIPFQPDSALGRRYDLTQALQSAAPPVALWMLTAKTDKYSYPTSATMMTAAHHPTSVTATVLAAGRHHPMFWAPFAPAAMTWLGQNVSGFHPA